MLSSSLSRSFCERRLSADCDRSYVGWRFFAKMLKSLWRLMTSEPTMMLTTICGLDVSVVACEACLDSRQRLPEARTILEIVIGAFPVKV